MSLINAIRDERDSWLVRFEEQRKETGHRGFVKVDAEAERKRIEKNRSQVGVFPPKKDFQHTVR